jgi:hypothetical protein
MLADLLLRIALAVLAPGPDCGFDPNGAPPACPGSYAATVPAPTTSLAMPYADPRPTVPAPTPIAVAPSYAAPAVCPAPYAVCPPYYTPAPAYGPPLPAVPPPPADDTVVRELVTVLDQTKSRDTFCLALPVLTALKGDGRRAIPAVLRNAERLHISRGMRQEGAKWTREQKLVADCLQALAGRPGARARPDVFATPPPAPPPPTAYSSPTSW